MSSKLRILCLHGFTSNGAVHAYQIRRLVSLLPEYDFLFPDGPHEVDISTQMDLSNPPSNKAWSEFVHGLSPSVGHRAWWFAKDANSSDNEPGGFHGLEESLDFIGKYIQSKGPIHAIWGFSQGACYAGMLSALLQEKSASDPLRSHFPDGFVASAPASGVIFSGFRPRFAQYDELYEAGIDVPLLHVLGEQDPLVQSERSEALMRVCKTSKLLKHEGGHDIPKKEEDLLQIVDFVRSNTRTNDGRSYQASI